MRVEMVVKTISLIENGILIENRNGDRFVWETKFSKNNNNPLLFSEGDWFNVRMTITGATRPFSNVGIVKNVRVLQEVIYK